MTIPADLEDQLKALWGQRDYKRVTDLVLEHYGDGIRSFVGVRIKSPDDRREAYAMFCADFWVALPRFRWECSLRGWAYSLARNAAVRLVTSPAYRARNRIPLSQAGVEELPAQERSRTATHLRSDVKRHMQELRERLDPDDQDLLVLRLDRRMSWLETAVILSPEGQTAEQLEARRVSLRKRFERVKDRLLEQARQDGLLPPQPET